MISIAKLFHAPGWEPTPNDVQRTRSWAGFWVVGVGDVVIVLAAIFAVVYVSRISPATTAAGPTGTVASDHTAAIVSIVTAAFTAVGTTTTAYFGIRAAVNVAQANSPDNGDGGGGDPPKSGGGRGNPGGSAGGIRPKPVTSGGPVKTVAAPRRPVQVVPPTP